MYRRFLFSYVCMYFHRSPIIVNELVAKADSGLSVCQIVTSMDVSTVSAKQNVDKCSGEVDTFLFVVLCMVGGAFMFIYILFALTIDVLGKKNLLGKFKKKNYNQIIIFYSQFIG